MGRVLMLIVLLSLAGCQKPRPDFLMRVQEDCAAGQQWACDLIDALSRPAPVDDPDAPDAGSISKPRVPEHQPQHRV